MVARSSFFDQSVDVWVQPFISILNSKLGPATVQVELAQWHDLVYREGVESSTRRAVKTQTSCVSCPQKYKFFGPHAGALYGRYELLDQLRAYKVRPAEDVPPHKFETGTKNHEELAGTTAAINYLADLGAEFGAPFADQYPEFEGRRLHLKTAMAAIRAYERPLAERLISGFMAIPGRDGLRHHRSGPLRPTRPDSGLHAGGLHASPGG